MSPGKHSHELNSGKSEGASMRRNFWAKMVIAGFLMLFIFLETAEARDYRVRKKAGGLTFDITLNRNPPVLGNNDIRIHIKDAQGNPV